MHSKRLHERGFHLNKHLLTKLLLVFPYLYVLIGTLCYKYGGRLSGEWQRNLFLLCCCFAGIIILANMIYPFVIAKRRVSSRALLFWNMILKLVYIPIYIVVFLYGAFVSLLPLGIIWALLLAFIDYLLLLPTSMYGVSGLLLARREGKITTSTAVLSIIMQFFFCTDVISAIAMYCIVRRKDKKIARHFQLEPAPVRAD